MRLWLAILIASWCAVCPALAQTDTDQESRKKIIVNLLTGGPVPLADWNFAVSLTPNGAGSAPTDSRLSSATEFNSSGTLVTVGSNVLRQTYNPATLQPLGIWSEGTTTNLQPYSGDPTNATGWSLVNATIATGITAPDGGTTGATLTDTAANSTHDIQNSAGLTVASGSVATMSIFFSPGTIQYTVPLNAAETSGVGAWSTLNTLGAPPVVTQALTSSGSVQLSGSTGPTLIGTYGGNTWYRYSISAGFAGSASPTSYGFNWTMAVASTNASFLPTYVGSGSTSLIWGGDFETNPFVSSHVITAASSATRQSDKITANCPLSSFPLGLTAVVRGVTALGIAGTNQTIWTICDDGTTNNYVQIYRNPSRQMVGIVVAGGVTQATLTLGTVADSTAFVVSLAVSKTSASASLNSGAPVTASVSSLPTGFTKTRFGEDASGATQCFCTIGRATLYNSYLPTKTSANDNFFERNVA